MRVVVTGAAGFIGSGLADHLIRNPDVLGRPIDHLILTDVGPGNGMPTGAGRLRVEWQRRNLTRPPDLDRLLESPVDCLFHLASIPGSAAESLPDGGQATNLDASFALANRLARQVRDGGPVPRAVFASTIAIYGALRGDSVDESAEPHPLLSYGAHKLMTEIFLADLSRRGEIDARSLRLPGIVPRPISGSGHGSAFMSTIFHKAAAGEPYVCPVSADAQAWWLSRNTCIANLLHAARIGAAGLPLARVWQMPVLWARVRDVVSALADHFGPRSTAGFRYEPDGVIEALYGRLPRLTTPQAIAAGFRADPDLPALVRNGFAMRETAEAS